MAPTDHNWARRLSITVSIALMENIAQNAALFSPLKQSVDDDDDVRDCPVSGHPLCIQVYILIVLYMLCIYYTSCIFSVSYVYST